MRFYNFKSVVGNMASVAVIQQSLINGTFPHISLFSGISGTGKSTCAEIAGLYLTCDSPVDGEPCCTCPTCKNNIKALQTTGRSNRLVKFNAGTLSSRSDIQELIREIFVLQSSTDNLVYVIEEVHTLTDVQQTALLEEIDKVPPNVFVIFCTTKPGRLLTELRNRALTFNFNRLSKQEMRVLLEQLCRIKGVVINQGKIKSMLLSYAKGIPRTLVELFEFIQGNDFEETTISNFLGIIDEESFILLFEAMKSASLYDAINVLEDLIDRRPLNVIISQLKDFMLRALFLIEGDVRDGFTVSEIQRINALFEKCSNFMQICSIIEGLEYNTSESEFKYKFVKIRQLLLGKQMRDIYINNGVNAVVQSKKAKAVSSEMARIESTVQNESSLKQLDLDFLTSLGGGKNES